jgi:hypothetical protein
MMGQEVDPGDGPGARYVLLDEARALFAAAGDAEGAAAAVAALAGTFVGVDTLALREASFPEAVKAAGSDTARLAKAGRAYAALCDDAIAAGRMDLATKSIAQAEVLARKGSDAETLARAVQRRKDLRAVQPQVNALPAMQTRLVDDPADPVANEAVGRFLCLVTGNWSAGLPHLAKAADPVLRKLARADLASARNAEARESVADAWAGWSEQCSGLAKASLRARAAFWYQQALPGLSGLRKVRVEKRLLALGFSPPPPPPAVATATGNAPTTQAATRPGTGARPAPGDANNGKGSGPAPPSPLTRLAISIVNGTPAESRPKSGEAWDRDALNGYLEKLVGSSGVTVDVVVPIGRVDPVGTADGTRLWAYIVPDGAVHVDRVNYMLEFIIELDDPAKQKLKPGSYVHLRGPAQTLAVSSVATAGTQVVSVLITGRVSCQHMEPTVPPAGKK